MPAPGLKNADSFLLINTTHWWFFFPIMQPFDALEFETIALSYIFANNM